MWGQKEWEDNEFIGNRESRATSSLAVVEMVAEEFMQ